MKLFLRMILIAAISYFASFVLPWWIIVLAGALIGFLIPGGVLNSFISGFLGVGIVWTGYAWKLDAENDSVFSGVILEILPLGDNLTLILTVGVLGGICGGLGTITGSLLRKPAKKKKQPGYYQ